MAVQRRTTKKMVKKQAVSASVRAAPKLRAIPVRQTKLQVLQTIADDTGMTRAEVNGVFSSLAKLIQRHMMRRGSGEISIPEAGIKIRKVRRAATKQRQGVNPFTGEAMIIAARPARSAVKLTALKVLKDTVT